VDFSLRVIRLVESLPRTTVATAIGRQLVRSGTSVGANYRAACRARSRAEFIAKLGTVIEEAGESAYWFELLIKGGVIPPAKVQPLLDEANELAAMFVVSRRTAIRNRSNHQSSITSRQ
jgi:four helix bundle protein